MPLYSDIIGRVSHPIYTSGRGKIVPCNVINIILYK